MTKDAYAKAEAFIREKLLARPKARGQGRSKRFIENTLKVAMWLIRKHAAYGPRIFSIAREVLARLIGLKDCNVRTALTALMDIEVLEFRPRATARKFCSPEFAAYQAQLSVEIRGIIDPEAGVLLSDSQTRQLLQDLKNKNLAPSTSGAFASDCTRNRKAAELWLPLSTMAQDAKRAALARLEALKGEPLPLLSPAAKQVLSQRKWRGAA